MSDGVAPRAAAPVGLPRELPRGWQSKQLRRVASAKASNIDKKTVDGQASVLLCNYVDVYYNRQIVSTLDFMEATATAEQAVNFELRQGNVLITKDSETPSDIGVPAFVPADLPGVLCGYHLSHIRPGKELSGAFLTYCFQAGGIQDHFYSNATGVTRFGLSRSDIGTCPIPLPPLSVQLAIAAHLDRETAKIDTLVAKKRELIAKLKEQRSALISRTVTRGLPPEAAQAAGLDPNPPMKDSGVAWLGEVPKHWSGTRLRFATRGIEQGWSPSCDNQLADEDQWGVLKVGCVNGAFFDEAEHKALPIEIAPLTRYEIRTGDILMSRANTMDLLGSAALVGSVRGKLLLCDKLYRLRLREELVEDFLIYFLQAHQSRFQLEREATGTSGSMQNIGQDTIKNLRFFLPPATEQRAIVNYLVDAGQRIGQTMNLCGEAITRLTEYRAALITAAVTGQVDVR